MKKFLLTLVIIFFAYYCAFITSGASKKQSLFEFGGSGFMYKIKCLISGETDTTDAKALFSRGENYLSQQSYDLAITDMKRVLELDSAHEFARLILGKALLGSGDTVSAIPVLIKQAEYSSYPPEALLELGKVFKKKMLPDSSLYYFKKAYESYNDYPLVNFELADYYFNKQQLESALEHINKAVSADEYNLEYRNLRRMIYIKQNNQIMADQDYQFIIAQSSEFFKNYKQIAEQENTNGNYQAAIENYKLALFDQLDNRELLEAKAWVYHKLGYYDSALIDFERVCQLYPDYLSYFNVAYTFDLMDKPKESVENYNKSIDLKSDYYITYNNRGYEFYRLKNFKKSEEDYNKSIELKSDYYLSLYNRGILYYDQKKYLKAINDYIEALKYAENKISITYSLALAYDKLNKKADAIARYTEYLEFPDNDDSVRIAYAKKRIESMEK
jgi:tetratricopeptide (TPR) repeat protein